MNKMLTFIQLLTAAVFAVSSAYFFRYYLAWSSLPLVAVFNALCAVSFGGACALGWYVLKNGVSGKPLILAGVVGLAVYEVLLWGIVSVVNSDGLQNRKAINTAYNILFALFIILLILTFVLLIKRSGKALNIAALALSAVVFITAAVTPHSTFLKNIFKGEISLYMENYVLTDRKYGENERMVFDLYIPKNSEHPESLILFIHGGGWIAGNKEDSSSGAKAWAKKGYITAAISYHYVNAETHMDVLMDDVTAALTAIKATAAEKGYDLKKCLLTGGSAGGHMSLLYAYKHGKEAPITPAAVVSYCGPADLTNRGYVFGNRLGNEDFMAGLMSFVCGEAVDKNDLPKTHDALWQYSPAAFAENAVPTVFAHGECDSVVPFEDTAALAERLTELGIENELVVYPHSDHDLAADPDPAAKTEELFALYAEKYL